MNEIALEVIDNVAVITLSAPERRNALTHSMAAELVEACETVDADPSVGAVVVRGSGGSFCAGAHRGSLDEAGADPAEPERFRNLGLVYGAFARVGRLEAPTIAAVRGAAVGAGANLALATDLRIMADDAMLRSGFLRIGIHPGGGHFTLVLRAAGRETAAAMAVFGEDVSGRRAVALGLAWESLPDAEVEPRALELAARAASDPELARATAKSLRLQVGPPALPWPVALEAEKAVQMWSLRRRRQA